MSVIINGTTGINTPAVTGLTTPVSAANGGTGITTTPVAGGVVYGNGTTQAYTSAGTAGGVLYSAGAGAPAFSAAGTSGQVLTSNGSSAPSWATPSSSVTLSTPVNTTSGTAIDFTGIPSTAKIIYIYFKHVSMDAGGAWLIQIGSSSGISSSGYESSSSIQMSGSTNQTDSSNAGFILMSTTSTRYYSGLMTLALQDTSTNTWVESAIISVTTPETILSGGYKSLTGTLDRIRITTSGGTAQFDAGSINIAYM